jgi:hypothetical protein
VPDEKKVSFDMQGRAYREIVGAIKDEWEKASGKEVAKRAKTHDGIEKNAVKNLSEHYNVEMKDGFPKEWEDLTDYEDFGWGKKWENHVWIHQEYQKLQRQRR